MKTNLHEQVYRLKAIGRRKVSEFKRGWNLKVQFTVPQKYR